MDHRNVQRTVRRQRRLCCSRATVLDAIIPLRCRAGSSGRDQVDSILASWPSVWAPRRSAKRRSRASTYHITRASLQQDATAGATIDGDCATMRCRRHKRTSRPTEEAGGFQTQASSGDQGFHQQRASSRRSATDKQSNMWRTRSDDRRPRPTDRGRHFDLLERLDHLGHRLLRSPLATSGLHAVFRSTSLASHLLEASPERARRGRWLAVSAKPVVAPELEARSSPSRARATRTTWSTPDQYVYPRRSTARGQLAGRKPSWVGAWRQRVDRIDEVPGDPATNTLATRARRRTCAERATTRGHMLPRGTPIARHFLDGDRGHRTGPSDRRRHREGPRRPPPTNNNQSDQATRMLDRIVTPRSGHQTGRFNLKEK